MRWILEGVEGSEVAAFCDQVVRAVVPAVMPRGRRTAANVNQLLIGTRFIFKAAEPGYTSWTICGIIGTITCHTSNSLLLCAASPCVHPSGDALSHFDIATTDGSKPREYAVFRSISGQRFLVSGELFLVERE